MNLGLSQKRMAESNNSNIKKPTAFKNNLQVNVNNNMDKLLSGLFPTPKKLIEKSDKR